MNNIMIALIPVALLLSPSAPTVDMPQNERIATVVSYEVKEDSLLQRINDFIDMTEETKRLQEEPVNELDSYFSE